MGKKGRGKAKGSQYEREVIQKFWSKVKKGKECWEWEAGCFDTGYGSFHVPKRGSILAHRFSMQLHLGVNLSRKDCVLHKCDNKKCVNPNHLFIGSLSDNIEDMVIKNRQAKGEAIGGSKLTKTDVLRIRILYKRGRTLVELGRQFSVHYTNVQCIVHRKTWKHL